jgi:UDP-N-acetylmuramoyl-L-alanyl-D-glutamate--2,6-diaminopimelate ligase
MERILYTIKRFIPKSIFSLLQKPYHFFLAMAGAIIYRFPSKEMFVIGITGTKGKSSTAEILNALLEEAGFATALLSTIRFKINEESRPNKHKMTMPGRFFIQRFLRQAAHAGCTHVILEMTSEGVKQFRHKYIDLDALIFTNISPEHIESHGSFENYLAAKLKIRDALENSSKKTRYIVSNIDDPHGEEFLQVNVEHKIPFSLDDVKPYNVRQNDIGMTIDNKYISSPLHGIFNLYNILAAVAVARARNVTLSTITRSLAHLSKIPGRVEFISCGQPFDVVVDYAHTPDSLEKLYQTFADKNKICVLGNTGGGRDVWKRPEMGRIADQYCDHIILTNEDPYDEKPGKIIDDMKTGIVNHVPDIILNRKTAIKTALLLAKKDDVVIISGKGTDPYIMGPKGSKIAWSDKKVAEEILTKT